MDEYRISLVVKSMQRAVTGRRDYTKDHLIVAREAFDEVCRTKEYEFGIRLFEELERRFTDVRDDLSAMRGRIRHLSEADRR